MYSVRCRFTLAQILRFSSLRMASIHIEGEIEMDL